MRDLDSRIGAVLQAMERARAHLANAEANLGWRRTLGQALAADETKVAQARDAYATACAEWSTVKRADLMPYTLAIGAETVDVIHTEWGNVYGAHGRWIGVGRAGKLLAVFRLWREYRDGGCRLALHHGDAPDVVCEALASAYAAWDTPSRGESSQV